MANVQAYAAHDPEADLKPFDIERKGVLENDVQIEIEYCGYATVIFTRLEMTVSTQNIR